MHQNKLNFFIFSANSKFFYKLNKELIRLGIKAKILTFGKKIPNVPCVILTTKEELANIRNPNEKIVKILAYGKKENFDKYMTRVISTYRIGYKIDYTEFLFSIDPGTKHIGLAAFLDDYYLISHTFYNIDDLLDKAKKYFTFLQENQYYELALIFKVGMGVLETTLEVVSNIFRHFKEFDQIKIILIDESKTSKIRIYNKENKIPKHEASALILALREGIEINKENFVRIFSDIKNKRISIINYNNHFHYNPDDSSEILKELIYKLVNGDLSLIESSEKLIQMTIDKIK